MGDASKAREKLGWEPKVDFEELVRRMYEADLAEESTRQGREPARPTRKPGKVAPWPAPTHRSSA